MELSSSSVAAMMLPLEEITTSYTFTFKLLPSSLWGLVMLAPLFPSLRGKSEVMLYFFATRPVTLLVPLSSSAYLCGVPSYTFP